MAIRYDTARMSKVREAPGGGLKVEAALARTGILEYKNADGSTRFEYRPASEVFAPEALESFRGAPVTLGHQGKITPENWSQKAVGHVGEDTRADEQAGLVLATVTVQRKDAIERIQAGDLVEVSAGYNVELDETPGITPEGQRYDAVQRFVRGNHLALGPSGWGRSGGAVSLRLDGDQEESKLPLMSEPAKAQEVVIRVDQSAEIEKLRGEKDALLARVRELEDPARIDSLVQAKFKVVDSARKVLGPDFKTDGLTDTELMAEVIRSRNKSFVVDGKSAEYISAAFDMALVLEAPPSPTLSQIRIDAAQAVPSGSALADAIKKGREEAKEIWKKPSAHALTRK